MLIAVPAETDPGKGRVAATPQTVKKFIGLGAKVVVQSGAGPAFGCRLWVAIGANPPGAKAPGYGSWAYPPQIPGF